MEFSVYHQVYNNKKATEFCISEFRKHNPDVKYYLLSDCGLDFSDIAEKYNCTYVHDEVNTGLISLTKDKVNVLISRLSNFFQTTKSEYGLYMEDDVLCRGEVSLESPIDITMLDVPTNKMILYDKILKYNSSPNVDWYGSCGGNFLRNIFDSSENLELINRFLNEDFTPDQAGTIDQLLPSLYLVCGYKCTTNSLLSDVNRDPQWRNRNNPLVHSYKENY
jgi:hypothetical protein